MVCQVYHEHHQEAVYVRLAANTFGCTIHHTTESLDSAITTTNRRGIMNAQLVKGVYRNRTRATGPIDRDCADGQLTQKGWHLQDLDITRVNREKGREQNLHKKLLIEICHLTNRRSQHHPWMNPSAVIHLHTLQTRIREVMHHL